jgi:hypothetical protein
LGIIHCPVRCTQKPLPQFLAILTTFHQLFCSNVGLANTFVKNKQYTMKQFCFAIALLGLHVAQAQTFEPKLKLQKGEKYAVKVSSKGTSSQMMSESSISSDVGQDYEVMKADTAYELTGINKRLKIDASAMGRTVAYDNEQPESAKTPMGSVMAEWMDKKVSLKIDGKGKSKYEDNNQYVDPAAMQADMQKMLGQQVLTQITAMVRMDDVFTMLSGRKLKVGETVKDSIKSEGSESMIVYTLKKIENGEATIGVNIATTVNSSMEMMGQQAEIKGGTTIEGDAVLDATTGILKKSTMKMQNDQTINAGAMQIPISSTATIETVVTKK